MIRLRNAVVVPLASVALLAGCGGDDKPSKADFVADADKVCQNLKDQTEKIQQSQPDNAQEIAQLARDLKKTAQSAVSQVEKIEVPGGDTGKTAQEWKDAVKSEAEDQLIPAVEELESAAEKNDPKAIVAAAQKLQGLESDKSDKLAKDLGLKKCGESGTDS